MQCPHCGVTIVWGPGWVNAAGSDDEGRWAVESQRCAGCGKVIIQLVQHAEGLENLRLQVWPRASYRPPCPSQVPQPICGDYLEACLVLAASPKASAALSRRCLQHILRDPKGGNVKPNDLAKEIDQVLEGGKLSSTVAESLDAVRAIGNFAAHPMKSTNSGEVLEVEPGEAEWNLDTIEALMDAYYVQPAKLAAKKAALNAKLAEAGKAPRLTPIFAARKSTPTQAC